MPIIFEWTNPYDKPVYITHYNLSYWNERSGGSDEPGYAELYHCPTAQTTKICAVNDNGDDFDDNGAYYTQKTNLEMMLPNALTPNQNWVYDDGMWYFFYQFLEAPIEIGVSKKFGHYIAGDFTDSGYDTAPVGIIQGYYKT